MCIHYLWMNVWTLLYWQKDLHTSLSGDRVASFGLEREHWSRILASEARNANNLVANGFLWRWASKLMFNCCHLWYNQIFHLVIHLKMGGRTNMSYLQFLWMPRRPRFKGMGWMVLANAKKENIIRPKNSSQPRPNNFQFPREWFSHNKRKPRRKPLSPSHLHPPPSSPP